MKNTDRLNQVTPLSKVLAAVVFITLPFIGFLVGFKYQNDLNAMYDACLRPVEMPTIQTQTTTDKQAPATKTTTTPKVNY